MSKARKYKDWYESKKDAISKSRSEKYRTDEKYRKGVRDRNRAYLERRVVTEPTPLVGLLEGASGRYVARELEVDGEKQLVFSIGAAAAYLEVSRQWLKVLRRRGVLPEAAVMTKTSAGSTLRYYTTAQLEEMKAILQKESVKGRDSSLVLWRMVQSDGGGEHLMELFSISTLASVLGRSLHTVSVWERKGQFPCTPLRAPVKCAKSGEYKPTGLRLYTAGMLLAARKAMSTPAGPERYREIEMAWLRELGTDAKVLAVDPGVIKFELKRLGLSKSQKISDLLQ